MTHDELLAKIKDYQDGTVVLSAYQSANKRDGVYEDPSWYALRAAVELHQPYDSFRGIACLECSQHQEMPYPCPTVEAIEKELA